MKIRLLANDSKIPNLAIMKISSYHKQMGDDVDWYDPMFDMYDTDIFYESKVFTFSANYQYYPVNAKIIRGGTGVDVFEIPDWSYENDTNETIEWGRYFYYNVVSRIQSKRFAIYYNDDPSIIKGWFASEVKDYITLELLDRSQYYGGLSATKIRDAIIKNNMEYVCKYCPMAVVTRMDIIRPYYIEVSQNPKPDFAME